MTAAFFTSSTLLPAGADLAGFLTFWARGRGNEEFLASQVAVARSEIARGTDRGAVDALLLALLRGSSSAELGTAGRRWYRLLQTQGTDPARPFAVPPPDVPPPDVLDRAARHRERGDLVVLVSDLPEPCVRSLATTMAADVVLAPDLVTDLVTDGAARPPDVRGFAGARGLDLAGCHAYGAVPPDLALLRSTGRATVVGDHPMMVAEAGLAGWCVLAADPWASFAATA